MLICVTEAIYITRSWSHFTSGRHPTRGSPRLSAICLAAVQSAVVSREGGARASPHGRRLRPGAAVTHPAPRAQPMVPPHSPGVWRGSAAGRCQGRPRPAVSGLREPPPHSPGWASWPWGAVGAVGTAALPLTLTYAVGLANAPTNWFQGEVSARSTLALSSCPQRWDFACSLFGERVRKCWWRTVGDRWQLLLICRRS